MKVRNASILAIVASALLSVSANAAETVIGGGAALSCYRAADDGWDPHSSIPICDLALGGILTPNDRAATLVNRGILKLGLNDGKGSLADFNRGLSMNTQMAEGYVDRGASLILLKRYSEALTQIDKGISMNAKRLQVAYFDRAVANEALGNIPAAYADYRQSQQIDPYFELPTQELKRFKVTTTPGT